MYFSLAESRGDSYNKCIAGGGESANFRLCLEKQEKYSFNERDLERRTR